MDEFEARASTFGWESDDFIDITEPIVEEDDPWGMSAGGQHIAGGRSTVGNQEEGSIPSQSEGSVLHGPASDSGAGDGVSDDGAKAELSQDLSSFELTNGSELSDEFWLLDAEDPPLLDELDYLDELELEEPEAVAEYRGDLGEALYEPTSTSEDLARTLRIDEFIAFISDANSDQRSDCAEILGALSAARLRYWLTWLRRQVWTGRSLLLFLDFRINCWEENEEWWEHNVWREWTGHWWAYSNPGTLSLDATYELINLRIAYPAEQIIDISWLDDWNEHSPWRLGVSSFAEFVLFRAGLKRGEDWLEILSSSSQVDLGPNPDEDRHVENASRLDVEYWFAIQDWHDTAEWHDNLGWGSGWVDAIHPYLPDASWKQHESILRMHQSG